jgi:putative hydrolases of HD superfamily
VSFSDTELRALLDLFGFAGQLKELKRQGWIDRGVDQPESVADHSYRLALMALVIGEQRPDIDTDRAVRLALVHDLPESLTGDRTPFDDRLNEADSDPSALFNQAPEYSPEADQTKTEEERQAMQFLTAAMSPDLQQMLIGAWEEYEAGDTAEARFVRQLDKLETWFQALAYISRQPELIIESFRLGAERDIDDPQLRTLMSMSDEETDPPS